MKAVRTKFVTLVVKTQNIPWSIIQKITTLAGLGLGYSIVTLDVGYLGFLFFLFV